MGRIWLAAAVLLVLAGWLLTGSPALAAPPTLGMESDTVGPGESLTVEVDLVDLEVGDSRELNVRRASDDGLAPACHGEGMGVETELGPTPPLSSQWRPPPAVRSGPTASSCATRCCSTAAPISTWETLDSGLWSISLALRTHEATLWALWTSGTLVRVLGAIETGQCDNIVSVGNLGLSGFAGSGSSLYALQGLTLHFINPTNCATSVEATLTGAANVTGLVFVGSTPYVITSNRLYTVNMSTGAATELGTITQSGTAISGFSGLAYMGGTLYGIRRVGALHNKSRF